MKNEVLAKHIKWTGYNHQWYRESFIFLGQYLDEFTGITFDLYFGYEIQNKHLQESDENYYSDRPMGVAVYGKTDIEIFECSLQTATAQSTLSKRTMDEIRIRAVAMGLIHSRYLKFSTSVEISKVIMLKQAGWKQLNKAPDGSRVWVLSENTTIDTDTAYDMHVLSLIKQVVE